MRRKQTMNLRSVRMDIPDEFHERVVNTLDSIQEADSKEEAESKESTVIRLRGRERMGFRMKKYRVALVAVAVVVVMLGTVTVAAVRTGLMQDWFAGNPAVREIVEGIIDYEVLTNTFEGVTFEMVVLYADEESLFYAVEAVFEEPVFAGHRVGDSVSFSTSRLIESFGVGAHGASGMELITDENRATGVWYISQLGNSGGSVVEGTAYTIEFYEISARDVQSGEDTVLAMGHAEIRFTVGAPSSQQFVIIEPDLALPSGDVLKEVKITPFSIKLCFYGNAEYIAQFDRGRLGYGNNAYEGSSIVMKNGEVRELSDIGRGSSGFEPTKSNSITYVALEIAFDKTFDVRDVAVFVYRGVEVPVG
jgi:hypothetical protein